MLSDKKVSLIGLYPTLAAALASLLSQEGGASVKVYSCACVESDQADIMITDLTHFSAHLDFFLPRKSKLALLYENRILESPQGINTIFLSDNYQNTLRIIADVTMPDINSKSEGNSLTQREVDVLKQIATGKTNKEIADCLNISVNTVITHRKNVSQKLGIRSASGLSLYALMNGLV